ncbi:hypothetical protein CEXT_157401 [Caerostris extrusa]|uniref:Uncharacterized protein n=1 Tax=Caerostris extrusa TaxID=172846 RepID=A0AAV4NH52_CAEEX|nr:hypothetical protein CEXT_157401 [Caerostris extrusa]
MGRYFRGQTKSVVIMTWRKLGDRIKDKRINKHEDLLIPSAFSPEINWWLLFNKKTIISSTLSVRDCSLERIFRARKWLLLMSSYSVNNCYCMDEVCPVL